MRPRKKSTWRFLILIALATMGLREPAGAACSGAITKGTQIAGQTAYDPFSIAGVSDQFTLAIRNTGSAACSYAVAFSANSTPAKLGAALSYDLVSPTSNRTALFATPATSPPPASLLSAPIAANASSFIPFTLVIYPGQLAAPGAYSDFANVSALLYGVEDGRHTLLQTAPLTISYTVRQTLGVNIAGAGTATTIDFGVLVRGAQRPVKIETRSNMPHHLRVTSDNHGVLALTPPIPGHAWTVPYTAMLDNRILDLSRAFSTPLRAQTTLTGDSHILNITIGDPSRKRAGLYKDVITILIVPN
jgi:hypothetical protein